LSNQRQIVFFGFMFVCSWQITPRALTEALAAGGGEAKRAFEAMMPMKKIDIATIEAARRG
jgi:predicted 3-demethylubiquinone-9 3-methyltransferase (glyoxalase superfamily)